VCGIVSGHFRVLFPSFYSILLSCHSLVGGQARRLWITITIREIKELNFGREFGSQINFVGGIWSL
jgi:hypothetical protein